MEEPSNGFLSASVTNLKTFASDADPRLPARKSYKKLVKLGCIPTICYKIRPRTPKYDT